MTHSEAALLATFFEETDDRLRAAREAANRLGLESNPQDLEQIVRTFHTIKGNAAGLGFDDLAEMSEIGRKLADALRAKKVAASRSVLGVLFRSLDACQELATSHASKS